jgi:hypothetical protein
MLHTAHWAGPGGLKRDDEYASRPADGLFQVRADGTVWARTTDETNGEWVWWEGKLLPDGGVHLCAPELGPFPVTARGWARLAQNGAVLDVQLAIGGCGVVPVQAAFSLRPYITYFTNAG